MELKRERYYNLNVVFLSILGLWPYVNKKYKLIQTIFFLPIVISILVCQLTPFITVGYTVQMLLKNLSPIIMTACFVLKYHTFLLMGAQVKNIMEEVKHDWSVIENEEELKILEGHTTEGRSRTIYFAITLYLSVLLTILSQFTNYFLDIVVPLNESRPYEFPFMTDLLIMNQEEHAHLTRFFTSTALIIVSTTFIATECMLVMWFEHTNGLFEIVCYRIKQVPCDTSTSMLISVSGANTQQTIANAVRMHIRAYQFADCLATSFAFSYAIFLILGIGSITLNIYRLSVTMLAVNEIDEVLTAMLFLSLSFGYALYVMYMIQRAINKSQKIFHEWYNMNWYQVPPQTRRLIILAMVGSIKNVSFNAFGVFQASMESFTLIMRISISYFTVIRSCQ